MKNLFVTYSNPGYFDILYWLLKSLFIYSENQIIVYVVNKIGESVDLPEKFGIFDNIIVRHINTNDNFWTTKYTIMVDSINNSDDSNNNYVYIDADIVVNYSIDEVFKYSGRVKTIPLQSIHPEYASALEHSLKHREIQPNFKKKWGHANLIWYNNNSLDFLKEGLSLAQFRSPRFPVGLNCEIIINSLQDKYNLTENIHNMTPYFALYKEYVTDNKIEIMKQIGKRKEGDLSELSIHLFHGCKDPKVCEDIFNSLELFNNNSKNPQVYYSVQL